MHTLHTLHTHQSSARPIRHVAGMCCKKTALFITAVICLITTFTAHAQVAANYNFTSTNGTYNTTLSGLKTVFFPGWSAMVANVPLPFTFYFNGKGYSSVWVSSNGFITFGETAPNAAFNNPISSNNGFDGSVSAFGLNNSGRTASLIDAANVNEVRSGTQTSGGNTVFVIQWTAAYRQPVINSGYADNINFQIRLIQNTNAIEVMYGACSSTYIFPDATPYAPIVGLGGATTSDFNIRSKTATGALSTTNTTTGATSSSYMLFSNAASIPSGLTMVWTPTSAPVACSGAPAVASTVTSAGITCNSVWLSLAGLPNATGLTYQWYRSYTGLPSSFTAITGAVSATYNDALNQSSFYRCQVSCGANATMSTIKAVGYQFLCPTTPTYTNNLWYGSATQESGRRLASFSLPSGPNTCGTSFTDATGAASGVYQTYVSSSSHVNYIDMTYLPPIKLQVGTSYTGGTITAVGTEPMNAVIWIDFNDDGLFSNANELVSTVSAFTNTSSGNVTLTIPAVGSGAFYGLHVMRLRTAYNHAVTDAWDELAYGSAKDYTVSILPPNQTVVASPVAAPAAICAPGAVETLTSSVNIFPGRPQFNGASYTWNGPPAYGTVVASINSTSFTPTSIAYSGVYTVTAVVSGAQVCAASTVNVIVAASTSAPTGLPGALTISGISYQGATGINFTPYSIMPDGYLIVASNSASAPAAPANGTIYATGLTGSFGANSVVISGSASGSAPPYSTSALSSNSLYYLYVYPFNIDCSGPKYYSGAPLLAGNTFSTCIAPPTGLTATGATGSTMNLAWTAAAAGGNTATVISPTAFTYTVHAYLDAGLSAEAIGYPVTGLSATTYTASGLNVGTTYYFVVTSTASGASCGTSSAGVAGTTTCTGLAGIPLLQNFDVAASGTLSPNCWVGNASQVSGAGGVYVNGGYVGTPFSPRSGPNYYLFIGSAYTPVANQWLRSPGLSLTPGTYNVRFWYISNSPWANLKAQYTTTSTLPATGSADMTGGIAVGAPTGLFNAGSWTLYSGSMTITTAGTYYMGINAISSGTSLSLAIEDIEICRVPDVTASSGAGPYCPPAAVSLSSSGSANVNQYVWSGPSGFSSSLASPVLSSLAAGSYTYSLTGVNDPVSSGFGGYCASAVTTTSFTVTSDPAAIGGAGAICLGQSLTLSETATGGTWSSGTPGVASVISGTGVVTGLIAGTAVISYTSICGAVVTTFVTVNPAPGAITGNLNVCSGLTSALSNVVGGGTWLSGSAANATIDNSGVVTGISAGTSVITYSQGGCSATAIVSVAAALPGITGIGVVCPTTATSLYVAYTGGYWSTGSGNVSVLPYGTTVTGITVGTAVVSYTLGVCYTTKVVTVSALPVAAPTNSGTICNGGTVTLTANPGGSTGGYYWNGPGLSSFTAQNPTATPTATATYSLVITNPAASNNCATTTVYTTTVTVLAKPAAAPASGGPICNGGIVALTANPLNGANTYVWAGAALSSSIIQNPTAAPTVSGIYSLTVSDGSGRSGCSPTTVYTTAVTVRLKPMAAPSNNGYICSGGTVSLSANPAGGATVFHWSGASMSSLTDQNPTAAPSASGVYSLIVSDGTVDPGCAPSTIYTTSVSVHAAPSAAPAASGPICNGGTVALSANPLNGANTYVWAGVALSSTSIQNPTAAPTVSGIYSLTVSDGSGRSGCAPATIYTTQVTVSAVPALAGITNDGPICAGATLHLSAGTPSNVTAYSWIGPVTVSASTTAAPFVATATTAATGIYTVTVNNGAGAGCTATYTTSATVNSLPSAASVTPSATLLCVGSPVTLTGGATTGYGTLLAYNWSGPGGYSATTTTSSVSFTPGGTAVGAYSLTVSYSGAGCISMPVASAVVTVSALPMLSALALSPSALCASEVVTLTASGATGAGSVVSYNWSGPDGYTSTTTAAVQTYAVPGPLAGGVYSLSVTYAGLGCSSAAIQSAILTINPMPFAGTISGGGIICNGASTTVSDTVAGGLWTSGATGIATVSAAGMVAGLSAGTATISYSVSNTCGTAVATTIANVQAVVMPVIELDVSPGTTVPVGTEITITANITDPGTSPVYEWAVNGLVVPGATTDVFISDTLTDGAVITCTEHGTGLCDNGSSDTVIIHTMPAGLSSLNTLNGDIRVMPNPSKGEFTVNGTLALKADEALTLQLTDMLGQVVYTTHAIARKGLVNRHVTLPDTLANGMYLLHVQTSGEGSRVFQLAIQK